MSILKELRFEKRVIQTFFENNVLKTTTYDSDDTVLCETITNHKGVFIGDERPDLGPSETFYVCGKKFSEKYLNRNGEGHTDTNTPSVVYYYNDGSIWYEQWHRHGQQHRLIEPASIFYNPQGDITVESFYEFGEQKLKKPVD